MLKLSLDGLIFQLHIWKVYLYLDLPLELTLLVVTSLLYGLIVFTVKIALYHKPILNYFSSIGERSKRTWISQHNAAEVVDIHYTTFTQLIGEIVIFPATIIIVGSLIYLTGFKRLCKWLYKKVKN